jgi:glycosyltransferase involved in cell wall biosynthesis
MADNGSGAAGGTVSVVIPTRDRLPRLARTLATVQAQDYPHVEIVVADDGSVDGTVDFVRSLADPRIVLIESRRSSGVSGARNRGIRSASGRWVALCDDDDLWHAGKLSQQVDAMTASGARWSICGAVHVDDDLRPLRVNPVRGGALLDQLVHANVVPGGCSSVVAERSLLLQLDGFDDRCSVFADYELWIRLAAAAEVAAWPGWGVLYVEHSEQMSWQKLTDAVEELSHIRWKHRDLLGSHGYQGANDLDRWFVHRLRQVGDRSSALRFAIANTDPAAPVRSALLVARAVSGLPLRPRPTPTVPPAAAAAAAAVRDGMASGVTPPVDDGARRVPVGFTE